jgi:ribosomal protein L11 methyltransferase
MNYQEIVFTYSAETYRETIDDILAAELGNIGFESFLSDEKSLKAYIREDFFNKNLLEACLSAFPLPNVAFLYEINFVEDKDWNEEWEKHYFQPIHIGKECLIRASFHAEEKGFEYEIIIDPKMAFGTGNHATTYLMTCEMLKLDLDGKELLDMGCGTAVLAILAAKKGANRIIAIDIDEWAYNNALENCKLNHTENIETVLGGSEKISAFGTFDFIFANINRNILLSDIKYYVPALKKNGYLYMSGFYEYDIPAIKQECENNSLTMCGFTEQNGWVAVKEKKQLY